MPARTFVCCSLLLSLFVIALSSCGSSPAPARAAGPSLSPEQLYARDMAPVLSSLDVLTSKSAELAKLAKSKEFDIAFCEEFFGTGDSPTGKPCFAESEVGKRIEGLSKEVIDDAFNVKSSLEAITPLPVVRTAHTQIAACLDFKMDYAQYLHSLAAETRLNRIEAKSASCDLYPNSVKRIKDFVASGQ